MEDNTNNTGEGKPKKKALSAEEKVLKSLSKIKLLRPIPLSDQGKKLPLIVQVHKQGAGFSSAGTTKVSYNLIDLEKDIIGMLKKEPKLASKTNATKEQMDFIKITSINKLRQNG
jgi:hypothetical protein